MVTNNPTYGCKQEKQNQPSPGPETGPYHKLVYTDNQYTVTQDCEIYSLAESGGDGCCTTEQQGYSVLKFNKIY